MVNLAIRHAVASAPKLAFIEDLDFGLYPRVKPERLYMAMKAFFDESGTHGAQSPVVTVAGFIATVDQWASYERDLSALLATFGVKQYHAKDFRQRRGSFKDWLRPKLAQFNSQFLQLADKHLTCGIAMVLPSADYQQIYRAGPFPAKARPDTQYGMCVRAALWKALTVVADRRDDWPLSVVLEGGHNNEGDAGRIFFEVKESLRPEYASALSGIAFGSKSDLPLAIADSLAYAIFRMSAGYSKHPTEPNAAVAGPSDPPYYVNKIPMSRTLIDENTLVALRTDLCG
jgi:hypothetical protein